MALRLPNIVSTREGLYQTIQVHSVERISGCVSYQTDFKSLIWQPYDYEHESNEKSAPVLRATKGFLIGALQK